MARFLSFALAGLLFGAGVTISGMVNPMKVLNFLDILGTWDPTLITVMGGGLIVTFVGYRIILQTAHPLFDGSYQLPGTKVIDARLVGGAIIFGLGWGLSGFCPAPALASLVFGNSQSLIFVAAMAAGTLAMRVILHRPPSQKELAEVEG